MKKRNLILKIGLIVVIAISFLIVANNSEATVNYRDMDVKINRDGSYPDKYAALIRNKIDSLEMPKKFTNFESFFDYYYSFEAPGCGSSSGGFGDSTSTGLFTFFSVQIPNTNRHKVVVYTAEHNTQLYHSFDSFSYEGPFPPVFTFHYIDDTLHYYEDHSAKIVRYSLLN